VRIPPGPGPVITNIAGGPYVAKVEGVRVVGRTGTGVIVVQPDAGQRWVRVTATADAGGSQTVAGIVSCLCLIACIGLVVGLTVRRRFRYRRDPV
jgi:hypothetical protein